MIVGQPAFLIFAAMRASRIDRILAPVNKLIHLEYAGGVMLLICVVVAVAWANLMGLEHYHHVWETPFRIGLGSLNLDKPLHVWINDGLMAVFFFLIGLELKREFLDGELSTFKKASLPVTAALGGMLFPALIYVAFNWNKDSISGWGIPMATDIAFALGLLSLLGNKVPGSVKVFLSALAVADDLGAVLVIAIFYTAEINFWMLLLAFILLLVLWVGNRIGVRRVLFYAIVGWVVWLAFLSSGVHATIAGVLVALTIPARTKVNERYFSDQLQNYAAEFEAEVPNSSSLTTPRQHQLIEDIKVLSQAVETPLQKIEYGLHPWVAFAIMPLFALSNAGIVVSSDFFSYLSNPVSLGVLGGLVIGKFIGILLFTWMAIKLGLSQMPEKANWVHVIGVSLLGGVGFTMSLFITGLAFSDLQFIEQAKAGILTASVIAAAAGMMVLKRIR